MKTIRLTKNKIALVDDEDFEYLNQFKWFYNRSANRSIGKTGQQKQIRMHNDIMKTPKGMVVDHINHDQLDNRRSNLRICTQAENNRNKRTLIATSGYKGVSAPLPGRDKWRVFIQGKFIGSFKSKAKAAIVYNEEAKKKFGKFAYLNII